METGPEAESRVAVAGKSWWLESKDKNPVKRTKLVQSESDEYVYITYTEYDEHGNAIGETNARSRIICGRAVYILFAQFTFRVDFSLRLEDNGERTLVKGKERRQKIMETLKFGYQYFKKYMPMAVLVEILNFLGIFAELLLPLLSGILIDFVIRQGEVQGDSGLSTIRNADRILYIGNQGIAEEGTHEELVAKKGIYYALASG